MTRTLILLMPAWLLVVTLASLDPGDPTFRPGVRFIHTRIEVLQ